VQIFFAPLPEGVKVLGIGGLYQIDSLSIIGLPYLILPALDAGISSSSKKMAVSSTAMMRF
jgi:hypothetical protein